MTVSCFILQGQAALFADLTSQPQLPSHNPDRSLIINRTQFLCKVVTGAMQTIQKAEWNENSQDDKVFVFVIFMGVFFLDLVYFLDRKRKGTYCVVPIRKVIPCH
jgi:hypothetical protein